MKSLLLFPVLALLAGSLQQPATRTFTGTITDSECADANHSRMRMGDTDPECVMACVDAHGASFVLFDGKTTYALSDQKTPASLAGRHVRVTGSLDDTGRRIIVQGIDEAR